MKLIECVPNFSEGNDKSIIGEISTTIESTVGVTLLDVDPGSDTNRTVITFVGEPDNVIKAAFRSIKIASELIDLKSHKGTHQRMGATDVCPLIPVSNVTMEECIQYSHSLAERVATKLNIPVFLYEYSATKKERKNLANIRSGEFEKMSEKMSKSKWKPDYGSQKIHPSAGVTAIGARDFLIAYNINLNTKDQRIATDIALDIRDKGRNKRNKKGKFIRDKTGIPIKKPGSLKYCKAMGWYLDKYKLAQVSINLTNYKITSLFDVFEEVRNRARIRGVRVTGSEIVGLIPLDAIIASGRYYLQKQHRSTGIPTNDIIDIAIKSLGLNEISQFDPYKKIIEYRIKKPNGPLISKSIHNFLDELSSDSPAPGGGSVSALSGALAASLTSMVANLTFGKKQWEPLYDKMCHIADKSQYLKNELSSLVDADTESFNNLLDSYRLPQSTKSQIKIRATEINNALKNATNVPYMTLEYCLDVIICAINAAKFGNPNSISDAGTGGEMAYAGAQGAALNIKINLQTINDKIFCKQMLKNTNLILSNIDKSINTLRKIVNEKIINESNS